MDASLIDTIVEVFRRFGDGEYLGEPVSQTEHALQAAWAAERAGASPVLVAGALLHDLGHLLHELPRDSAEHGVDTRHEDVAAAWLAPWFHPSVVDTVRLHVAAKRYLCAVDPSYLEVLSPASVHSLQLQGGPMTDDEVAAFAAEPHADDATAVRRFDDEAKVAGLVTPPIEHFRPALQAALLPARAGETS